MVSSMRRRILLALTVFAGGIAACADILGIDDGIPRSNDASIDVTTDAAPDVRDAAVDSPDASAQLFCGTGTTCNLAAGEACCRTGSVTYVCVTDAAACSGTYVPCDGPSQCPQNTEAGAMQCCTNDVLDDAGNYVAQSVGCVPAGTCTPVPTHYILCHDNADCPDANPTCGQSTTALPTFLICK